MTMTFSLLLAVLMQVLVPLGELPPDAQTAYRTANEQVRQGRADLALQTYEALLDTVPHSGVLLYNAGVASQAMNRLGMAKVYFIAAERYPETRQAAREALRQTDERLPYKTPRIPRYPWQKVYDVMVDEWGSRILIGIAAAGLHIGALALAIGLVWGFGRSAAVSAAAGFSVFVFFAAVLLVQRAESHRMETGVVVVDRTPLFENPEPSAETPVLAYEGGVLRIDKRESTPDWVYVTLENGSKGWIKRAAVHGIP